MVAETKDWEEKLQEKYQQLEEKLRQKTDEMEKKLSRKILSQFTTEDLVKELEKRQVSCCKMVRLR